MPTVKMVIFFLSGNTLTGIKSTSLDPNRMPQDTTFCQDQTCLLHVYQTQKEHDQDILQSQTQTNHWHQLEVAEINQNENKNTTISLFLGKTIANMRVAEAFYRVRTLEGVLGHSPCMGPGMKPCVRKWF